MQETTKDSPKPLSTDHEPAVVEQNQTKARKQFKLAFAIMLGAGLFMLGTLVGNGTIQLRAGGQYGSANGLPTSINYKSVTDLYSSLKQNYSGTLTEQQVLDGLKHGLAQSTKDPYTQYFTAEETKSFNSDLQGEISGVGAKLELDTEGNVVIVAPLAGSPAEAAGLRAKDVIVTIDGKATTGMTASDAVVKIRGKKGTNVKLGVVRDGKEALSFTITRDTIKVPTVTSKTLDGGIGYLQVSQFSDDTDELVNKAAADFKTNGIKKVILDLRDNPGGEVTTAVNLSSLWLQQGDKIVEQRRGKEVMSSDRATSQNLFRGFQTVVLVNGGSASASEITALALRDHGTATIIGEKTYGKGVVQQLIPFDDGSSLKVTIAKWYSPNGTNIDKTGIKPNKVVTPTEEDYKANNDVQLQAAIEALQ